MTLEKTIDKLTQIERFSNYPFLPGDKEALNLAIEAVKRVQYTRFNRTQDPDCPLPGETKE